MQPLFADFDGIVKIIGALTPIALAYLAWKQQQAKATADSNAVKLDQVAATTTAHAQKQVTANAVTTAAIAGLSEKVAGVADQVEVVRHTTNSLTEQLVATTDKEAFARGQKDERDNPELPKTA